MKMGKILAVMGIVSLIAGAAGAAPPSGWPNQKGEICLQSLENLEVLSTIHMYISKMGDNHYLVLGRSIEPTETVPFIGSAEIVEGGMVRIHATVSGADTHGAHGAFATLILDAATLEGTVDSVDIQSPRKGVGSVTAAPLRDIKPCP